MGRKKHSPSQSPGVLLVLPPKGSLRSMQEVGQLSRFLEHYVGAYHRRGVHVGLLSFGAREDERKLAEGAGLAALVAPKRPAGWPAALWLPLRHRRVCRRFPVWRGMQAPAGLTVLAGRIFRVRTAMTYGYDYVAFSEAAGHRARARLLDRLLRVVLPRMDIVFVTSEQVAEKALLHGTRPASLRTVENAAPVVEAPERERCPRSVAWIGRLAPQKRLDIALAAAERVGARLVVAGSGTLAPEQRRRLEKGGGRFAGVLEHPDALRLLDESEVLLLTSDREGTPKVVIEALARGTAALVPDLPELRWLWADDEPVVACFRRGDVESAARELSSLLDARDRRERLAAAGHALARRRFDIRATVDREVDILLREASLPRRVSFVPMGGRRVASSRYRVYTVAEALAGRGVRTRCFRPALPPSSLSERTGALVRELVSIGLHPPDALVLQRPGRRREERILARFARARGSRIVVGSEVLRKELPEDIRGSVTRILPTPLPAERYRRAGEQRPVVPVVGWIGDGPAHAEMLSRVVGRLAEPGALPRQDFRLRLVGVAPSLLEASGAIVGGGPIEFVPDIDWADENAVAEQFGSLTVGLAPYRGRPGVAFKIIQYMAAGTFPLIDLRSPGAAYVAKLPQDLQELCLVDYFDDSWCRSLAKLLDFAHGGDAEPARERLRKAARGFDVDPFADALVA